jgi:histidine triad (HIT) family protein
MPDCTFCKIIKGEVDHLVYWEDDQVVAFLTKNPVNLGHTLIVPKNHTDYIFDLENKLYSYLFDVAKKLAGPVQTFSGSKRIGISVSGFQIPHVHVHIIPLNSDHDILHPVISITEQEGASIANALKKIIATEGLS